MNYSRMRFLEGSHEAASSHLYNRGYKSLINCHAYTKVACTSKLSNPLVTLTAYKSVASEPKGRSFLGTTLFGFGSCFLESLFVSVFLSVVDHTYFSVARVHGARINVGRLDRLHDM